jgi:hypothetical protein
MESHPHLAVAFGCLRYAPALLLFRNKSPQTCLIRIRRGLCLAQNPDRSHGGTKALGTEVKFTVFSVSW